MSLQPSPRIALATLAALTLPVPIGLASARTTHRVERAKVQARPHHVRRSHVKAPRGSRPTLLFSVSGPDRARHHHHRRRHPLAHAAGDPGDTISDFKFSPASITIHVGDTITWTNAGPTDHTATANDGSFNTGILKKGQSASHTFTQAGTFAYVCSIHPFMHGTVVVVGSAGAGSSPGSTASSASNGGTASGAGGSTSGGSGPSSSASGQSSAATLPNTGLDLGGAFGTALLLLGLGTALRRRTRAQR